MYKRKFDLPNKDEATTFLYVKRIVHETTKATCYEVEVPPEGNWLDKESRQIWIPKALIIENYFDADKSIAIPIWFYNQLIEEGKL